MCSMSVLCPLCAQTSFSSIDALRCSLIKAANGPLACPICHEMFLGLDKLTIHLFSHTNIMNAAANSTFNNNNNSTMNNKNIINNISKPPEEATMPTTLDNTQNIKNFENFKTIKEIDLNFNDNIEKENQNKILNCCNSASTTNLNYKNTTNTQQQQQKQQHSLNQNERDFMKKAKVTAKTNREKPLNVNNLNAFKQQQVAAVTTTAMKARERVEEEEEAAGDNKKSKEIAKKLATCDICEFTFRNEELKNMHIRLVHQDFECHAMAVPNTATGDGLDQHHDQHRQPQQSTTIAIQEPNFKCHLCSKTFKMKGSLRVHLKVVHLMGLPCTNNTPKINLCDRIRNKENTFLKTVTTESMDNNLLQNNATPALLNIQPISLISNINTLPEVSVAAAASTNVNFSNLNQSLDFQQSCINNSNLQASNVLLVFNTAASANQEILQNVTTFCNNNTSNNIANGLVAPVTSTSTSTSPPTNREASANLATTASNGGCGNFTENPKIWECDVCTKAFTTKYFLKKHKRLHTGEMPYTCKLCSRTFTFQQSYHKHLLYHSDEKPHVCSTCGRAFKELSTLHNHERIHSGEKPFKCEVCGKSFRQRVSFLVHTRIHTGVMPYKCELCQRSFRYKVSQRTHKCQLIAAEDSSSTAAASEHNDTTIERMSENFIREFLEKTVAATNQLETHLSQSQNSPASNEIAIINEKSVGATVLNEQQALLSKTIDDIVVESCNKLGIGNGSLSAEHTMDEGSMSPSQRLQNMRLYSPPQLITPDLNGIDGDLTRFFLENSQNANNLL